MLVPRTWFRRRVFEQVQAEVFFPALQEKKKEGGGSLFLWLLLEMLLVVVSVCLVSTAAICHSLFFQSPLSSSPCPLSELESRRLCFLEEKLPSFLVIGNDIVHISVVYYKSFVLTQEG